MSRFLQDLKHGWRLLGRNPSFTAIVIATLALGIGANTAIFSLINGVFLRPLPYPQSNRLVYALWESKHYGLVDPVSWSDFVYWKAHSRVFAAAGSYQPASGFNLVTGGQAHFVRGTTISSGLFKTLGIAPALGRGFLPEECRPGGPQVAIVSHRLWRNLLGSDRDMIGRQVHLNGKAYTVVGVTPKDFQFVAAADVYLPIQRVFVPENQDQNYALVGRLKPGITLPEGQQDSQRVFDRFREEYPAAVSKEWQGIRLIPYQQELTGDVRTPLLILFGAVGLVLLIAIANTTSLFLERAHSRQAEMAMRSVLGASRLQITRQLLAESVLLALLGGALGLWIAPMILQELIAIIPKGTSIDLSSSLLPLGGQVHLNGTVLLFTLLVSLFAGVATAVLPALKWGRSDLAQWLKEAGERFSPDRGHRRARNLLVVFEVALTMMLLAGAGLLMTSFLKLRGVNPGFDVRDLWTLEMSLPTEKYQTTAEVWKFDKAVLRRLRALPGVTSAASTSNLPVERGLRYPEVVPDCGLPGSLTLQLRVISPGYFRTMDIPLLRGRDFLESDTLSSSPVAAINQALAGRCWANRDPLGAAIGNLRIVGVVGNTVEQNVEDRNLLTLYIPQAQAPDRLTRMMHGWFLSAWVIRTKAPLRLKTVQEAIAEVDPTQPVAKFRPMVAAIASSFVVAQNRFLGVLIAVFACLALLLAAIGVYGVVSYSVSRRTHEIGIRMALGARKEDVLRLVVGQGLALVLIGVAIGLAGALALTRLMASLLYGVSPRDPLIFAVVSAILIGVALWASYIPARRAAKVDPITALHHE